MRHWKNTAQLFPRLLKYWGILLIIKMLCCGAIRGYQVRGKRIFAPNIILADMVDIIGNSRGFSGQQWKWVENYLNQNKGRLFPRII